MRETRIAQASIFDFYALHETGIVLERLSHYLDQRPEVLAIVESDIISAGKADSGRRGMAVDSIFRCMLLKQQLDVSYEQLAFYLSDSRSFSTFARVDYLRPPSRSALQANIRKISPESLEKVFDYLTQQGVLSQEICLDQVRIDSTVTASNIAPPSDSRLLDDSIRVLCRLMKKSAAYTGIKLTFTDYRPASRALAFRIFNAKKPDKDALYVELLSLMRKVISRAESGIMEIEDGHGDHRVVDKWLTEVNHTLELAYQVVEQTERRILHKEKVTSVEKIVSIFEPHTDIIVKSNRGIHYGHKINVASDKRGVLTHISIEKGNASDVERFVPILKSHHRRFGAIPTVTVADGGYASQENVQKGRSLGVAKVVFHKKKGITLTAMGVKQKTFARLKNFRAGIEANISHLKRCFGLRKATWKRKDGYDAYIFSAAITYNVLKLARLSSG